MEKLEYHKATLKGTTLIHLRATLLVEPMNIIYTLCQIMLRQMEPVSKPVGSSSEFSTSFDRKAEAMPTTMIIALREELANSS